MSRLLRCSHLDVHSHEKDATAVDIVDESAQRRRENQCKTEMFLQYAMHPGVLPVSRLCFWQNVPSKSISNDVRPADVLESRCTHHPALPSAPVVIDITDRPSALRICQIRQPRGLCPLRGDCCARCPDVVPNMVLSQGRGVAASRIMTRGMWR